MLDVTRMRIPGSVFGRRVSPLRKRQVRRPVSRLLCIAYTIKVAVFDWDQHNLKKIMKHRIKPGEVEEALFRAPILIYEQDAEGEARYV
jgi:hypothetical protein